MDFDNRKVYGDTSIIDGLVFRHPEVMQPLVRHSGGQTVSKQLSDQIFVQKWLRNKLHSFVTGL